MATFRKRGDNWRAEVCVRGVRRGASFSTKKEAQAWASREETRLRDEAAGAIPDKRFADLMERYAREVSPTKRGGRREQMMIAVILRDKEIAERLLRKFGARDIAAWRDRRLRQVSAATVEREMNILSNACAVAKREWGWLATVPTADVSRPPPTPERTRRPTESETEALLHVLGYGYDQAPATRSARVGAAYLFAMETAMRAGEICGLRWEHVYDRHVHLPVTKNGFPRDVPLSAEAQRIIGQLRPVTGEGETVFDLPSASLDALFRKAKKQAMIEDLHFHDTRREALTRLSKRLSVMELARVSGHRDLRILQNVYYSPATEDLAEKINQPSGGGQENGG